MNKNKEISCFLCDRDLKWKEVYICYLNDVGERLDFCLKCGGRWHDENKREGVQWGVGIFGQIDFEFTNNPKR